LFIVDLNNTKAQELLGKIDSLILPVGTLEAHGPHCSVASDILIPVRVCEEVERLAGDRVFIAPVIPYGHNFHLLHAAGTHNVPSEVFADYVFEVLRSFENDWKIKYAIIFNGHGGNTNALHVACERASTSGIKTLVMNWWGGGFAERIKNVVADTDGHGGESETSFLWFVADKYVDQKLIPKEPNMVEFGKGRTAASYMDAYDPSLNRRVFPKAYSGNPAAASKEKGERMNRIVAQGLVEALDALRSGTIL
jgi:creatinine amidohydrolase